MGKEVKLVWTVKEASTWLWCGFEDLFENEINKNVVGNTKEKLHAGSYVRVNVNIVGSQDTTGLMTSQELEMMAATLISPVDVPS